MTFFMFVYKLDPVKYQEEGKLDELRQQRGYSYEDEVKRENLF